MELSKGRFSSHQPLFQELFIGTLIYVMVLGLFNDYTSFVSARSFSTIIYASVVLEVLTYMAFRLKTEIITLLKSRKGRIYSVLMFCCVWLVMFLSKFVFVFVFALDLLFSDYITITGFFGILLVVVCVTLIHRLAYVIFNQLGETKALF